MITLQLGVARQGTAERLRVAWPHDVGPERLCLASQFGLVGCSSRIAREAQIFEVQRFDRFHLDVRRSP